LSNDVPRPPAGLRAPGRQLWNEVTGRYVLTAGGLEILRQLVQAVDEADMIKREQRKQPVIVAGHAGQPRPNPLNKMLDDKRELIRKLICDLDLPDIDDEAVSYEHTVGVTAASKRAQKAAMARWHGGG
jgi:DNA-binding transcriptional LysR family regulator